ncbi:MAG TPA: two-component regulator propeller domain-containing protein [Thermoanaerobaculia bacterium]|nr:two-component regulator propeller domain-containing protein [Thermoanaerobaculia bacterium]HQN08810.1 two-component regulator propeller domain-containing protein [Thermoanaerobaculia bacterium]HQP88314.1 two-component regulator propeller domain-containing protein [Thermoanaerobaculia bacterium]
MALPIARRAWLAAALALLLADTRALSLSPERQLNQYAVSTWQTADGLPMNSVLAMTQAGDGSLWIGTEEGLVRFDGAEFEVRDRGNTPSMDAHNVQALCTDEAGAVWAGTYGAGLLRWDGRAFSRLAAESEPERSRPIRALARGDDGSIWIGTAGGLERLVDDRRTRFAADPGLASSAVLAISPGRKGRVWVATVAWLGFVENGALHRLVPEPAPGGVVLSLAEGPDGALYVGTDRGLFRISTDHRACERIRGLSNDFVSALAVDQNGALWVGTNGGLHRIGRDGRIERLTTGDGLSSDMIQTLLLDREGNLWFGTRGGGLGRLRDGDFVTFGGAREGFVVDTVLSARSGGVFVGGWNGFLARLGPDGRFEPLASPAALAGSSIRALFEEADGTLLVGAWNGLYRARDGHVERVPDRGLIRNVRTVHVDQEGAIWVGLEAEGLVRLQAGKVRRFTTADGLGGNEVRALLEDRDGTLWVATYGGLSRRTGESFTTLTTRDGLRSDLVRSLALDADGAIWIGTYGGGIARLDRGVITSWDTRDGLYTDVAYAITEDDAGDFWISSNRGVYRVARADLEARASGGGPRLRCRSFGIADGMASEECNGGDPAVARTADGRIYFPTVRGVVAVAPTRLLPTAPPRVRIDSVVAGAIAVDHRETAEVPAGTRRLELRWAALGFLPPLKTEFRYRLDGFDDEWVEAGTRRVATYTNLPPGSYSFRVVAGLDGSFGSAETRLPVRVGRLWWQTWWARAALGFALAGLLGGAYRLRTGSLARDRRRLEEAVAARSAELAEANRALEEAVVTDPLTKARNRRFLDMALDSERELAVRSSESKDSCRNRDLILYLVDLDRFKSVNDRHGHRTGDLVLVETARRLQGALRRTDFLVRWGGEEFLVVARGSERRQADVQARRLLEAVGGSPYSLGDLSLVQTCSIGWAPFPWLEERPRDATIEEVLGFADRALYEAKRSGRNGAVGYVAGGDVGQKGSGESFEEQPGRVVEVVRTEGPRTG